MEYVEILRGRRALFWYTLSLAGLFVLTVVSIYAGHGQAEFHVSGEPSKLSVVFAACAIGAWIVLTVVSPGLNAEGATIPIIWSRPSSRMQTAWRYVAVDVVAIALGYLILLAFVFASLAIFGVLGNFVFDREAPGAIALAMGTSLMWYGLIVLSTSRLAGRGAMIAGLSWVAFLIVGGVWAAPLPWVLHAILTGLNYLNPIAWFGGVSSSGGHSSGNHPIQLPTYLRIVGTWAIAALSVTLGVRLWATREI